MCSILGILEIDGCSTDLRQQAIAQSARQRHRGPDATGVLTTPSAILIHERLSIIGIDNGSQPIQSNDHKLALVANGEIYNHQELRAQLSDYRFLTDSDNEVILALYQSKGMDALKILKGMFAFIVINQLTGEYLVARDPLGIIPLYMGRDAQGRLHIASELKAIENDCVETSVFPPGHYLTHEESVPQSYFQPLWRDFHRVPSDVSQSSGKPLDQLSASLSDAVTSHLVSDAPFAVLLSGGLDSSVIAALARQTLTKQSFATGTDPQLNTFAVGLAGSPDLIAAQQVADHIGSQHHTLTYTLQQGIDALSDVIFHLETYDITTIRAATPMYLLARKIRSMGFKMVLSGEGSDELFGGYLYFHKAPDAREFHEETVRKIERLHLYDCLRANKAMSAWGIETRVPFLDRDFVETAMNINPQDKMITAGKIEKQLLREAFAGLLPDEIVWRQKEQFSDGVGYRWIDGLQDYAERQVSDEQLADARYRFPINTPLSKEAFLYRAFFEKHFPNDHSALTVPWEKSIACSTEVAIKWDQWFAKQADPSGRAIHDIHRSKAVA